MSCADPFYVVLVVFVCFKQVPSHFSWDCRLIMTEFHFSGELFLDCIYMKTLTLTKRMFGELNLWNKWSLNSDMENLHCKKPRGTAPEEGSVFLDGQKCYKSCCTEENKTAELQYGTCGRRNLDVSRCAGKLADVYRAVTGSSIAFYIWKLKHLLVFTTCLTGIILTSTLTYVNVGYWFSLWLEHWTDPMNQYKSAADIMLDLPARRCHQH